MPLTLTVSSVIALMSARLSCVWLGDAPPDLADAVGQVHEERQQAERQQRSAASRCTTIATTVVMTMTRLAKTLLAVSVTTAWTPPTSLDSRLWISPVRVSVKKRSGMPLQVGVQRVAQVLHHALADDVVEVRLADADEAR